MHDVCGDNRETGQWRKPRTSCWAFLLPSLDHPDFNNKSSEMFSQTFESEGIWSV